MVLSQLPLLRRRLLGCAENACKHTHTQTEQNKKHKCLRTFSFHSAAPNTKAERQGEAALRASVR
jgi:hypothetical protein